MNEKEFRGAWKSVRKLKSVVLVRLTFGRTNRKINFKGDFVQNPSSIEKEKEEEEEGE